MFTLHQQATRFTPPAVSAHMARNRRGAGALYGDEDAAMRAACETMCEAARYAPRDPAPVAHRHPSGSLTLRSDILGLVFVLRRK